MSDPAADHGDGSRRVGRRDLTASSGEAPLAGSLWTPPEPLRAVVLMHPGSGPSDRDNDVYFPPIREHLLTHRIAVASFDKRGVGGSGGRWEDAGIVAQSGDALAAVRALEDELGADVPVGLFGHSQGGWVVIETASRGEGFSFVIANSGPGVTPAEQERYAARVAMEAAGVGDDTIVDALHGFDRMVELIGGGVSFEAFRGWLRSRDDDAGAALCHHAFVPSTADELRFASVTLQHDPRPALARMTVPVLAIFGAEDRVVPVEDSVASYRRHVRSDLLEVAVLTGGDHRIQSGDPPRFVGGYLERITSFIASAV